MINTKWNQTHIEQMKALMVVTSSQVYKQLVSIEHAEVGELILRWATVISALQPGTNTKVTSDVWTIRFNRLVLDSVKHLPRDMPKEESPLLQLYWLNQMLRTTCINRTK